MIKPAAARLTVLDLLWCGPLSALPLRRIAPLQEPGRPDADTLPAARLQDLGFGADQVVGNIDFAKGQHFRHF